MQLIARGLKWPSDGWTIGIESSRPKSLMLNRWGIALLWYRPNKRLSVSIWSPKSSRNIRLYGPKLLPWQKRD
jgi:hypothetical protein